MTLRHHFTRSHAMTQTLGWALELLPSCGSRIVRDFPSGQYTRQSK